MGAGRASELRKFLHFHILKLLFLLIFVGTVPQILCRYKWHACRLTCTCTDKFFNVPTKLREKKALWGGANAALATLVRQFFFIIFSHSPPLFVSFQPQRPANISLFGTGPQGIVQMPDWSDVCHLCQMHKCHWETLKLLFGTQGPVS